MSAATLNPRQREAVATVSGPMLILAGAGTGKTRVVTERIAALLRSGCAPENILGVTFTNKAAAEMRERLAALVGKRVNLRELVLSTFHSLCVRILRRDAGLLGYAPGFSICDQGEQSAIVRKAASTVKGAASLPLDAVLRRLGQLKNQGIGHADFSRRAVDEDELALASVFRRYQEELKRRNSFDFDDLLTQTLALLKNHPESREYWQGRFKQVTVDEFQDTNQVQFELVRLLAAPDDNLCVVGDDDQSIYAWRGALAGNIGMFNTNYPQAKIIALEQNYRSTSAILDVANILIANNPGRREKNLWSDLGAGKPVRLAVHNDQLEEAEATASEIAERIREGAKPSDFAVLVRANAQTRPFEDEFLASRIPFEVVGGQSLLDRKEARDALAFLAVAVNPHADNQLLRIVNTPARGIGEQTVDFLAAHARGNGCSVYAAMTSPAASSLAKSSAAACRSFAEQIRQWNGRLRAGGLDGLIKDILEETRYVEELTQLYRDPVDQAARWNEALEIGDSLTAFADRNGYRGDGDGWAVRAAREFLQEAALSGKEYGKGDKKKREAVRIVTVHSAKGLEFPIVYVPGMEEEQFPHKNAIEEGNVEEERRLFYVAITRARRELTLSHCRARLSRGKPSPRKPSRFLAELPEDRLSRRDSPTRLDETKEWLDELMTKLDRPERKAGTGRQ